MHYQLAEKMNVIDMFFIELTKYSKMKKVILFLIYKLQGYRPWGYPQILADKTSDVICECSQGKIKRYL